MNARQKWREMRHDEARKRNGIETAKRLLMERGTQESPESLAALIAEEIYVAEARGAWYAAEHIRANAELLQKTIDDIYEAAEKIKQEQPG
jgi:hypothetical protein